MTPIHRAALAVALYALAQPSYAQWQADIGLSARSVTHTEYDTGGGRLVRESGWLPGLALQAGYTTGKLTWLIGAEAYRGDIDYRGRTQAGVGAASTTATGLGTLSIGARHALTGGIAVLAVVEAEYWRRDIRGTAGAAGLQERYRTRRLVLGADHTWQPALGAMTLDAALVLAAPAHLRVGFSGLLDPAAFTTRRGHGIRLGTTMRPAFAPQLALRARYDWSRTPRSADAPLTSAGRFVGTVAQPEHVRQAVTLTLSTLF